MPLRCLAIWFKFLPTAASSLFASRSASNSALRITGIFVICDCTNADIQRLGAHPQAAARSAMAGIRASGILTVNGVVLAPLSNETGGLNSCLPLYRMAVFDRTIAASAMSTAILTNCASLMSSIWQYSFIRNLVVSSMKAFNVHFVRTLDLLSGGLTGVLSDFGIGQRRGREGGL